MSKKMLICTIVVLSFNSFSKGKIVYGEDNRKNYYESSKKWQKFSKSVGGIIFKDRAIKLENSTLMNPKSLGKKMGLCPEESFKDEPGATSCTFFLVAKDKVVTAGHCVKKDNACENMTFIFDYTVKEENARPKMLLKNEEVYKCKKILSSALENIENKDETVTHTLDYALVELDREVTDREPLKLKYHGRTDIENFKAPKINEKVVVLGHPSGLPMKIADGAKVVKTDSKHYFTTNLDTFGGNSGSPVLSESTGEVLGILVRGQEDYIFDEKRKCNKVNIVKKVEDIKETVKGESVSHIYQIEELYK